MNRRPPVVLLAAGESSRFWPLSTHGHKSLHRLCGKAIIEHTVTSLARAGYKDIIVVQSPYPRKKSTAGQEFPHRPIAEQLGDGARYAARLRYVDQPEALGQGDAILRAAELFEDSDAADGTICYVVQPENVNAGEILAELDAASPSAGSVLAVQEREETWLFGVCVVEGDRVTGIVEKPEAGTEPSKLCSMAVAKLTADYLKVLKEMPVDPISNVAALEALATAGELRYVVSDHPFFPLKYPWHLFAVAEHLKPAGRPYLGENVRVDPGATVADDCVIEADTVVGAGVELRTVLVGGGSDIRSSASDSIFGADVSIEPDVTVATRPVEHGHVRVDVKGREIDTSLPALGATIGQGAEIDHGSKISAGVMIGAESRVTVGTKVSKNLPDRSGGVEKTD